MNNISIPKWGFLGIWSDWNSFVIQSIPSRGLKYAYWMFFWSNLLLSRYIFLQIEGSKVISDPHYILLTLHFDWGNIKNFKIVLKHFSKCLDDFPTSLIIYSEFLLVRGTRHSSDWFKPPLIYLKYIRFGWPLFLSKIFILWNTHQG